MKKLIGLLLLCPAMVLADNCDNPRDDFDGLYCLNKVYLEADKELNAAYKELRALLGPKERSALKTAQLKWIESRNNDCSFRRGHGFFVNLKCARDTTVSRANVIRDRIRECKATGCQPSKLHR